jgi:hypothetical protein
VETFAAIPGITPEVGNVLVHAGFSTLDALFQAELSDLEQIEQIKDQAPAIMKAIRDEADRRKGGEGAEKREGA